MKQTNEYSVSQLITIMEDYGNFTPDFTEKTEVNSSGDNELIVYVTLGQSLDVLGIDDVYYDSQTKRYFIFFSTFLTHLNRATEQIHTFNLSFVLEQNVLSKLKFEVENV